MRAMLKGKPKCKRGYAFFSPENLDDSTGRHAVFHLAAQPLRSRAQLFPRLPVLPLAGSAAHLIRDQGEG